jgi:hypothetical protein
MLFSQQSQKVSQDGVIFDVNLFGSPVANYLLDMT